MTDKTRTVVLLRRDVAPGYWRMSWSDVVAAAESGNDGVRLVQQPLNDNGVPLHQWSEGPKDAPVFKQIAPPGWAAHYEFRKQPFLHFQNY